MSPSPLDDFWTGVLSLLTPIVTPDWGKLVGLIPLGLLLLVLAFLGRLAMAWRGVLRSQPARGVRQRRPSLRPLVIAHVALALVGVATVVAAFVVGSRDANWQNGGSPLGLVVSLPLLLLGLVIVVAAAGSAARLWDRHGREDLEPDLIDRAAALVRRHPGRAKRAVAFFGGVVLAASAMELGTVPGIHDAAASVAIVPLLLLGLALAVGAVGSAIAAVWPSDPDFDSAETSVAATEH